MDRALIKPQKNTQKASFLQHCISAAFRWFKVISDRISVLLKIQHGAGKHWSFMLDAFFSLRVWWKIRTPERLKYIVWHEGLMVCLCQENEKHSIFPTILISTTKSSVKEIPKQWPSRFTLQYVCTRNPPTRLKYVTWGIHLWWNNDFFPTDHHPLLCCSSSIQIDW